MVIASLPLTAILMFDRWILGWTRHRIPIRIFSYLLYLRCMITEQVSCLFVTAQTVIIFYYDFFKNLFYCRIGFHILIFFNQALLNMAVLSINTSFIEIYDPLKLYRNLERYYNVFIKGYHLFIVKKINESVLKFFSALQTLIWYIHYFLIF